MQGRGSGWPLGQEPRLSGRRRRVCWGHDVGRASCGHTLLAPDASDRGADLQGEGGSRLAACRGGPRQGCVPWGDVGGASACLELGPAPGLGRDQGADRLGVCPPTRDARPGRLARAPRRARDPTPRRGRAGRFFLHESCPREPALAHLCLGKRAAVGHRAMLRRRQNGARDGPRCRAERPRLAPPSADDDVGALLSVAPEATLGEKTRRLFPYRRSGRSWRSSYPYGRIPLQRSWSSSRGCSSVITRPIERIEHGGTRTERAMDRCLLGGK